MLLCALYNFLNHYFEILPHSCIFACLLLGLYILRMIICLNGIYVSMTGCAYIHMHTCAYVQKHTCAHMCVMNIKDVCSSVHAYMQMGVSMTLFAYMCGSAYVNTCDIWMVLVC